MISRGEKARRAVALAVAAASLGADARATLPGALDRAAPLRAEATSARAEGVVALRARALPRVLVPAGTFVMGSTAAEVAAARELCARDPRRAECTDSLFFTELEAHEVTLSTFWLDRTEVTYAAYARCVALDACRPSGHAEGGSRFARPELPVTLVAWEDANTYCARAGGRLPTEAEWERAARGLGHGTRFPWGDAWQPSLANHGRLASARLEPLDVRGAFGEADASDGFAELAPVGSFPAGRGALGADDLAGNVEEWTLDAVDDVVSARHAPTSAVDPRGPTVGALHVVRGGSYESPAAWLRTSARAFRPTGARLPTLGFRCAYPDAR